MKPSLKPNVNLCCMVCSLNVLRHCGMMDMGAVIRFASVFAFAKQKPNKTKQKQYWIQWATFRHGFSVLNQSCVCVYFFSLLVFQITPKNRLFYTVCVFSVCTSSNIIVYTMCTIALQFQCVFFFNEGVFWFSNRFSLLLTIFFFTFDHRHLYEYDE